MRQAIPSRAERGAAAVEFALVVPVLFLILFGIIDYGLWFADGLSVRDGTRAAARAGSLHNWGSSSPSCGRLVNSDVPPTPTTDNLKQLACSAVAQMSPVSGKLYLYVRVLAPGTGVPTGTWDFGAVLRICAIEVHTALLPLIPMPGGGVQHIAAQMPVEEVPIQNEPAIGGYDTAPSGQDWSWC